MTSHRTHQPNTSAQPFNGYYQTIDYAYWQRGPNAPTLVPITEMQVKAQIARPGFAEAVCSGEFYRVCGAAWTTDAEIAKVEISTDAGATWNSAHLIGEPIRNAWRLWEYDWQVPMEPVKATLMARATDSKGRTQPTERNADLGSYVVNHLLPIEVDVRSNVQRNPMPNASTFLKNLNPFTGQKGGHACLS